MKKKSPRALFHFAKRKAKKMIRISLSIFGKMSQRKALLQAPPQQQGAKTSAASQGISSLKPKRLNECASGAIMIIENHGRE